MLFFKLTELPRVHWKLPLYPSHSLFTYLVPPPPRFSTKWPENGKPKVLEYRKWSLLCPIAQQQNVGEVLGIKVDSQSCPYSGMDLHFYHKWYGFFLVLSILTHDQHLHKLHVHTYVYYMCMSSTFSVCKNLDGIGSQAAGDSKRVNVSISLCSFSYNNRYFPIHYAFSQYRLVLPFCQFSSPRLVRRVPKRWNVDSLWPNQKKTQDSQITNPTLFFFLVWYLTISDLYPLLSKLIVISFEKRKEKKQCIEHCEIRNLPH